MALERTESNLELLNSIKTKMENKAYVSLQKDLLDVLQDKKEEAIWSKNHFVIEELEPVISKISSQKILIQELWQWDEIGYEFLVSEQKQLYNNLIAELLK